LVRTPEGPLGRYPHADHEALAPTAGQAQPPVLVGHDGLPGRNWDPAVVAQFAGLLSLEFNGAPKERWDRVVYGHGAPRFSPRKHIHH
jgi:hypothetical protein